MNWTLAVPLVCALLMACDLPAQSEKESSVKRYKFTKDWTTRNETLWKGVLLELAGRPNIHALEVGVYEGRSTIWLLDHILTGEGATITALDPWENEGLEARFTHNIEVSGHKDRVIVIKGYSQEELPLLRKHSYDLIYIDGCHDTTCVHLDTAYSWRLLRPGGFLIWDDAYGRGPSPAIKHFLRGGCFKPSYQC